ncbi:MAG: MerR family transcriptional regulator [Firmicutes bacterium]|nr:MerR family transcriptional regulator [Bacillota bacterium]
MLKIGEVVKIFNLSHRTLHHWEEEKILSSNRADNGYRYYDDFNISRIKQIVFLRKLKIPIADIERIFKSGDVNMAIDVLTCHLYKVRQETIELGELYIILDYVIEQLESKKCMSFLSSSFAESGALLKSFSENERRISMMKMEPDRIVRLPKMIMACYRAEGESPEMDCWNVVSEFIAQNSLHESYGFRHFGFNNPNPSDESPVYGYEMWVSIPENVEVKAPFYRQKFSSGLYANVTTTLSEIGEQSWKLNDWVNNNGKYIADTSKRWLEEFTDYKSFWENPSENNQIDLLAPIVIATEHGVDYT